MSGPLVESITWQPVADGLPDAELNVLLWAEEAGSFEGFFDGHDDAGQPVFRDVTALAVGGVEYWANMPKGLAA